MAERTFIPNSPACAQWEMLLADALDGRLRPEDQAVFTAHRSGCPACAALFEEARRGREWLEFLSPEPEVPAGLLDRILAQTGPGQIEGFGLMPADSNVLQIPQPWQRPGFMGNLRRFAEPRLLMTAAMAFFSIALTLNLTGVRLSSLRLAGLRPTAVRSFPNAARSFLERRLTVASTPVIRYYDHSRFVYEVQSRMRELRRFTEGEDYNRQKPRDAAPGESRQIPVRKHGDTSVDPPQQSGNPVRGPARYDSNDFLESSLTFNSLMFQGQSTTPATPALRATRRWEPGSAHSGGSATVEERSTVWTA
ncbi:MAG: zf-HC2 domain-containing protein [Terracidiphilus sp.]|jgi:hypothetical protein